MNRDAVISDCGRYRYLLTRSWGANAATPMITWCMLNPSTAGAIIDDPTVRKCVGFAERWGYGGINIVNLFAWRATDPRELRTVDDPVGPANGHYWGRAFCAPVIAAWGGSVPPGLVTAQQKQLIRAAAAQPFRSFYCLGRTKHGEPRHPLMLAYTTPREPWPVALT